MITLRNNTRQARVGNLLIGGNGNIIVQSMTNTDTANIKDTAKQIIELHKAGSELVRITVNTEEAARAVPYIKEEIAKSTNVDIPLCGCFHYNGHLLLEKYPECADTLDKYRINPGNVGFGNKKDKQFEAMIRAAINSSNRTGQHKAIRIGVNWGSLDKSVLDELIAKNKKNQTPEPYQEVLREAMTVSALSSADSAEKIGFNPDQIIISCKASLVEDVVAVYDRLAERSNYPLHLGLTEAGMGDKAIVSSVAALSIMLNKGYGNTIRVSITPRINEPRTKEVKICQDTLHALGLRSFAPTVSACPGCGRTNNDYFKKLAEEVTEYIEQRVHEWTVKYPGSEKMRVAVMACIVNGPGESKHANIGISLPGSGEDPIAPVFIDGQKAHTLRGENIAQQFKEILENYVSRKYAPAV